MRASVAFTAVLVLSCSSTSLHNQVRTKELEEIRIEDNNWLDVTIYIVSYSGIARRLGMVRSSTRSILKIPSDIGTGSTVYIVVDPIGSDDTFQTEGFYVSTRKAVIIIVGEKISHSTWYMDNVNDED